MFQGSIALETQGEAELESTSYGRGRSAEEEKERMLSIIERLNDKFGTNFSEADKLSRD